MVAIHTCPTCGYSTKQSGNYNRHRNQYGGCQRKFTETCARCARNSGSLRAWRKLFHASFPNGRLKVWSISLDMCCNAVRVNMRIRLEDNVLSWYKSNLLCAMVFVDYFHYESRSALAQHSGLQLWDVV